jgi:dTMP kinase
MPSQGNSCLAVVNCEMKSVKPNAGLFVSIEGIEGGGKTTVARFLAEDLARLGHKVLLTREPGGTAIGDGIRQLLLDPRHEAMAPMTELLLYNAARVQHLQEVILPALAAGSIVITDRFTDSTKAYQGFGRGLDLDLINKLDSLATGSLAPHVTILLDLDAETGLARNRGINKIDRLELEDIEFHRRVRRGFHELARLESHRIIIVDASADQEMVRRRALELVTVCLASRQGVVTHGT